jgi:hypothetical protein
MVMPRNHGGIFITLYMRPSLSQYMLFMSEFIIIYFVICEAYQPLSHSRFHTAIIFKCAAAENLIQPCERLIIFRWRVILTMQAVKFFTNKTAYNVKVLYEKLS